MMSRLLAGLLVIVASSAPAVRAQSQSLEYDVKAAFLYNFARFVTWPADSFAAPDAPLSVCVLGEDPFGSRLDQLVEGERVNDRPLAVRRLSAASDAAACHLVFVSPSERARFGSILSSLDTRRLLTVSDTLEFLEAGGHLSFYIEDGHVRFAVNAAAIRECDFKVSSRLLQVARIHQPAGEQP
jgi:hypothetical protein